jgi:hypothetical protein
MRRMRWSVAILSSVLLLASPSFATAATGLTLEDNEDTLRWSYNDYGGIGLLQTRNARMADDGRLIFGHSRFGPHQLFYLTFQATPWLEATFRYDIFRDALPTGDLFDRSFDTKIRLWEESRIWPDISVGFQDVLGTGILSSEYLVVSKRFYDFDFSLGLGWGRMGTERDFGNPLAKLSSRFETRGAETGAGGKLRFGDFFSGQDTALFGGIEYITPIKSLRLKLEFNGDAFLREQQFVPGFENNSRLNFGVEYRPFPWVSLAAAYEQGDMFMLRAVFGTNAKTPGAFPKKKEPLPALPRDQAAKRIEQTQIAVTKPLPKPVVAARSQSDAVSVFFDTLDEAGIVAVEVGHSGRKLEIMLASNTLPTDLDRARRIIRSSGADLPLPIEDVEVGLAAKDPVRHEGPPGAFPRLIRASAGLPTSASGPSPKTSNGIAAPSMTPPKLRFEGQRAALQSLSEQETVTALLQKDLEVLGLKLYALKLTEHEATVYFENMRYRNSAIAIGRGMRVISNAMPRSVEVISIVLWDLGLETARLSILRKDLENALANKGSSEEIWVHLLRQRPTGDVAKGATMVEGRYPAFEWWVAPALRQGLFDPNAPYIYQLWLSTNAKVKLARGLNLSATVGFNITDTFDRVSRGSDSRLPHVRSDVNNYIKRGRNSLDNLRLSHVRNIGPDLYGRLAVGYLEEMFAGVAVEALYRPLDKRWALGIDINGVQQREFEKRFGLQDYRVVTGHVSLYYDVPSFNYLATINAGRYLARDWGMTFQLARRFNSGIEVGAFATFTNVPFREFGEGSFDKGIFLTIPLDLFFTRHSRLKSGFVIRPLTRDGGQRVGSGAPLYSITDGNRFQSIRRNWGRVFD